ncbi:MAG: ATP-dependent zinc metalloprotease FtsH [bacterium]
MPRGYSPRDVVAAVESVFRRMNLSGGGANPAMGFGKSNAKLNLEKATGVTFEDVAGCDEAKDELVEIVQFLREPDRYTRLGGKVPKGVLLVGPPGTGKTLLARAVAGEADVPFFNLSGSDFVEMFVGVGAARVRDLFAQAKTHAPCIIFVDELDAIGKSRTNAIQSNEEREQTLNAMLVEMDGFDGNANVIVLAATNRPEVLDPALLRPGRFDRQVVVDRPDVKGRHQILKVHARHVVMSEDLNLEEIAKKTPGFVGADLANICNEAALLAARKGKSSVETADFNEAIERVIAGLEKKSRRLNDKEKDIVAYHESGHAIVSKAIEGSDRVQKVSIVSRGIAALGYTLQVPEEDRYLMTKSELHAKICGLLGGRAAEEIVFQDISTGAANDLQRVTDMARRIVADFGMSDILGNVSYGDGENYLGNMGVSSRRFSEKTAETIDDEITKIVFAMYTRTLAILRDNHDLLVEMSERLKDIEVLEGAELEEILARVKPYREMGFDGSMA